MVPVFLAGAYRFDRFLHIFSDGRLFFSKLADLLFVEFDDVIRVKIRDEGFVRNKAIYIALGILSNGTRDILTVSGAVDWATDGARNVTIPFW